MKERFLKSGIHDFSTLRWLMGVFFLVLQPSSGAHTEPTEEKHPHQGMLEPYQGAPPPVTLTREEAQNLQYLKPVFKQIAHQKSGRGAAVFLVKASPDSIWSVISDFRNYPKWIDNMKDAQIYRRENSLIYVRFRLGALGYGIDYFIRHDIRPHEGWGTWTLDYDRKSEMNDSVGFWRVKPHPEKAGMSIVDYSADISIKGWIPDFVRSILVEEGLEEATEWIRIQAEAFEKRKGLKAHAK